MSDDYDVQQGENYRNNFKKQFEKYSCNAEENYI